MRLTAEKKRKNSLIYLLVALTALLGLSIIYVFRLAKKNKIISDQNIQIREDKIRELELTIYRIIQELVNNALKHACATKINVEVISEPKRLFARVTDNGKGFDVSEEHHMERKGKGLQNIRDRVVALNGIFDVWSKPGQGTEISAEIQIG